MAGYPSEPATCGQLLILVVKCETPNRPEARDGRHEHTPCPTSPKPISFNKLTIVFSLEKMQARNKLPSNF